jgi:hypothetical protein
MPGGDALQLDSPQLYLAAADLHIASTGVIFAQLTSTPRQGRDNPLRCQGPIMSCVDVIDNDLNLNRQNDCVHVL